MHAYRNIALCTKDCLCLYVCPTGATDTETGQIDFEKCTGCGDCVTACPSGALTLVPTDYPKQQNKKTGVIEEMKKVVTEKIEAEQKIKESIQVENDPIKIQLLIALAESNRIMAEDIEREAGFMLPQSGNVRELLLSLLKSEDKDLPIDAINLLLEHLNFNE